VTFRWNVPHSRTHTGVYMFTQQTHAKLNKIFETVKRNTQQTSGGGYMSSYKWLPGSIITDVSLW